MFTEHIITSGKNTLSVRDNKTLPSHIFIGLSVALLILSGCVKMPDLKPIEPVDLSLEHEIPQRTSSDVKVTNSAGEVIVEGRTDRNGRIYSSSNTKNDMMDGKLNIEVVRPDGTRITQTVTHTPGTPVRLNYNRDTGKYDITEASAVILPSGIRGFTFSASAGTERRNRPDSSFLRYEDGGMVVNRGFLNYDNEETDTRTTFSLDYKFGDYYIGGIRSGLSLSAAYSRFDSSSSDSTETVQAPSGYQTAILSPDADGSLGGGVILAQGNPSDLTNVNYGENYREYDFSLRLNTHHYCEGLNLQIDNHIGYTRGDIETAQGLSGITNVGTLDFVYDIDTESEFNEWGLGTTLTYPLTRFFSVYGGYELAYRRSETSGSASLDLSGALNASENQDFEENDSSFRYRLDGGIKATFNRFDVGLGFYYEEEDTPQVDISGDHDASVSNEETDNVGIYAGLRVAF